MILVLDQADVDVENLRPGCDWCNGEHEWEGPPYGYDPRDGQVLCEVYSCEHCDGGRRDVDHEIYPITCDELEDMFG